MSDYNSALPVRTENAGDLIVKVGDATIPSQQLTIDSSGRVTAKNQDGSGNSLTSQVNGTQRALDVGINVAGVQVDPRSTRALTSTDVVSANIKDGTGNALTSSIAGSTRPLDVAIRDAAGVVLGSIANPVNVIFSSSPSGSSIDNYLTTTTIAAGATSNHDYTVTTGKTLIFKQIEATGSGKMKIEVQIETGAATGVFNTIAVQFNSTSNTNMSIHFEDPKQVVAGARVRVIRTNRDIQSQDVYSTIMGQEV